MSEERYRVLAIDYGTKRVGLAVSDELRMLASSRGVLPNSPTLTADIVRFVSENNVKTVLIGIPKTLANSDSEMTREVRAFLTKLSAAMPEGVKILERDERLTSVMANANILERGLGKVKRQEKSLRDEEAARIVLQEYLDSASRRY